MSLSCPMSDQSSENPDRRPRGGSGSSAPGLTSWRSAHRARSHESAHADDNAETPPQLPSVHAHPLVPRDEAELIDHQRGLESLVAELRQAGSFAYDTEFIGELTYHPMLCLIQVATSERVTLLDPMSRDIDLRPLW